MDVVRNKCLKINPGDFAVCVKGDHFDNAASAEL